MQLGNSTVIKQNWESLQMHVYVAKVMITSNVPNFTR